MRYRIFAGVLIGIASLFSANDNSAQEKVEPEKIADGASLPPRCLKRFGADSLRHGSRIQCLLFEPKSGLLIAGGGNDPIRLWDIETGKRGAAMPDPWTMALALHPKDRQFTAGGAFRALKTWNPYKSTEDAKVDGAPAAIRAIVHTLDGNVAIAGCQDGQLYLSPAGAKGVAVAAHKAEVNALAASRDGRFIVSGGGDRAIRVYNPPIGSSIELVKELKSPGMVHALAFSADSRRLISAGDDRVIRLWDTETWTIVDSLKGHDDTVLSLAAARDGKFLVSGGYDRTIRVWDLAKKIEVRSIPRNLGDSDALALSLDDKWIAVGGFNNVIRLFDRETGVERKFEEGPQAGLAGLVFQPKSSRLLAISTTGSMHSWNADTGQAGKPWETKSAPLVQQDFVLAGHPDGSAVLTGSSAGTAVEIRDAATGASAGSIPLPQGERLAQLRFAPSGKMLALALRSGRIEIIDWPTRKSRGSVTSPEPAMALAFSANAPIFAVAAAGKVILWDLPTLHELRRFSPKDEANPTSPMSATDLVFSPDGRTIAVAGYDGFVHLADWTLGKHLRTCEGHTSAVHSVAFSPDGRWFASTSFDKTVRLWETFMGQSIIVLPGHQGPVKAAAFSADGRIVYTASSDCSVLAWDVPGKLPTPNAINDLPGLWLELANEDVSRGNSALWTMVAAPRESATFLEKQMYLVDPKKIDRLFADLNSEVFAVRERATQELEKYGRWMEGRLETALRDPPTLESRRRLERMINILRAAGALTLRQERLRMHRVLSILEQTATPEAKLILESLTHGAPEPDLQREADLALKRVNGRG